MTGFLISIDKRNDSYNLILVIVDQQTKMIYYEPVKITINVLGLADVIMNVMMRQHGISESIIID